MLPERVHIPTPILLAEPSIPRAISGFLCSVVEDMAIVEVGAGFT